MRLLGHCCAVPHDFLIQTAQTAGQRPQSWTRPGALAAHGAGSEFLPALTPARLMFGFASQVPGCGRGRAQLTNTARCYRDIINALERDGELWTHIANTLINMEAVCHRARFRPASITAVEAPTPPQRPFSGQAMAARLNDRRGSDSRRDFWRRSRWWSIGWWIRRPLGKDGRCRQRLSKSSARLMHARSIVSRSGQFRSTEAAPLIGPRWPRLMKEVRSREDRRDCGS